MSEDVQQLRTEVALLAEGVDRNIVNGQEVDAIYVALLAEGVDRNCWSMGKRQLGRVALLAEGVDRNFLINDNLRRRYRVALLAEGVDRNKPSAPREPYQIGLPPRGGRG